jgi:hypothetical protein
MRLFLRIRCRIHEKYQFWNSRPRLKILFYFCLFDMEWPTWNTTLKVRQKMTLKKTFRGHIDFVYEIEPSKCVEAVKIWFFIENTIFEISAVEWELFWKNTLRLCSKNRMKMDSNLYKTMENLENFTQTYVSFEFKISCFDILGVHFVNLTLFWPKISRKVYNSLYKKGEVLGKNVI